MDRKQKTDPGCLGSSTFLFLPRMNDTNRGFVKILKLLWCTEVFCHIIGVKTADDSALRREKGKVEGTNQKNNLKIRLHEFLSNLLER